MNCKNCASPVIDNYCSACGHPRLLKRVDGHYIIHEIQHILHFEKGILYTVKGLLTHPGKNIREFITENRNRLVKPIIFIIITSLIYSTINHFFHVEEGYVNYGGKKDSATTQIFAWVQSHYGYANIIMGVFIALWARLFFRKYNYNFFEILILLCFVMGMGMLLFSVFTIAEVLSHTKLMQVSSYIVIAYCTWAIAQFFNGKKVVSYVNSFFAYLLGMLTFALAALLIGFLVDAVFRH
ncbi:DUF3667 domain-containing protein [Mucilaginibacter terrigena]|uniref:DUF3667 domain-containing protein n=1 Tax=Mucilaginibacter terrigena TaxID=2492395 RepID=A0A4Q5LSW8_9SPHI|nr:DUF3667 domain-containing protein [Mucilaginibacter terrigena]